MGHAAHLQEVLERPAHGEIGVRELVGGGHCGGELLELGRELFGGWHGLERLVLPVRRVDEAVRRRSRRRGLRALREGVARCGPWCSRTGLVCRRVPRD